MRDTILLVRHTEVARAWHGRCYGARDVPLSRSGRAALADLSARLAADCPRWVVHSGLVRTRLLAQRVAVLAECPLHEDADWRERDFGAWEGRTWTEIYRTSGNAMDGMIDAPSEFRPGGGETTSELADRATAAYERLPGGNGLGRELIKSTLRDGPERQNRRWRVAKAGLLPRRADRRR